MYPEGTDAEWFGIDAKGYIARFTTGGVGPLPKNVIIAQLPWFYETNELDIISGVNMMEQLPRPDDFMNLSMRGIYGYDWNDVHRSKKDYTNRYELISKPTQPVPYDKIKPFFGERPPVMFFEKIEFKNSMFLELSARHEWVYQNST